MRFMFQRPDYAARATGRFSGSNVAPGNGVDTVLGCRELALIWTEVRVDVVLRMARPLGGKVKRDVSRVRTPDYAYLLVSASLVQLLGLDGRRNPSCTLDTTAHKVSIDGDRLRARGGRGKAGHPGRTTGKRLAQ